MDDAPHRPWWQRALWTSGLVVALGVALAMTGVAWVFIDWAITGYWGPEQPEPWRDAVVAVGLWMVSIACVWAFRPLRALRRVLSRSGTR